MMIPTNELHEQEDGYWNARLIIDQLINRRRELQYTQQDVDDLMDNTRGQCGKWECGSRVPLSSNVSRWADVLDCSVVVVPKDLTSGLPPCGK